MKSPPTLDSAVLGRILLLQSTLPAASNERRLMEMVASGMMALPGVVESVVCIEGHTITARDSNDEPAVTECPLTGMETEPWTRIELQTSRQVYGFLSLRVQDQELFSPYLPFVGNTVNLVAIEIENERAAAELNELNRGLDQQVEERTRQLSESERRLREAQVVGEMGSFEGSVNKDELWWSDELYRLFGLDPAHFIPTKEGFSELLHPEDRDDYIAALMRSLQEGAPLKREFRARHSTGEWRHYETIARVSVDDHGIALGMQGTVQDITKRKQAEESLRTSDARYRILVESSPYCIHQIDSSGSLMSMNKAGLEMINEKDERAVVGVSYLSAVCDADRERVSRQMEAAFKGQASEFEFH